MKPYYHDELAGITIYHGDCREVLPTLPAARVDLVLTDPPYGTDVPRDGYGRRPVGARHIVNDGDLSTLADTLPLLASVLASPHVWVVLFCSPKNRFETETVLRAAGLVVSDEVVWNKLQPGLGGGIRYQHETVLLASFGKAKGKSQLFTIQSEYIPNTPRKSHPHEKPVGLLRKLATYCGGSMILDPFAGSGATLRAAKDNGCHAIGIEICEAYCEIAAKRLSQGVFAFTEPPP